MDNVCVVTFSGGFTPKGGAKPTPTPEPRRAKAKEPPRKEQPKNKAKDKRGGPARRRPDDYDGLNLTEEEISDCK